MERMKKPKFIKEIEKSEGKERAKCGRWYIRVYGELDHKPMVELESLEIVVKELHKLEEENKKLKDEVKDLVERNIELDKKYMFVLTENNKLKGLLKEHITTYDVHFDELIEENRKLKLHIEAKDKAYTALLKDYEEIKEDRDKMKAEIEQRLNAFRNR